MKITILTYGTRGDVQPFIALAFGLKAAGHEVTLAGPTNFEGFVKGFGLDYAALHGDSEAILKSPEGQAWLSSGDALKFTKRMQAILYELRHRIHADTLAACEGTDLIVGTVLSERNAHHVAELMGKPLALAYTFPLYPPDESQLASIFLRPSGTPSPLLNRLTNRIFGAISWRSLKRESAEWRAKLGLPPIKGSVFTRARSPQVLKIHAYSRHLVPQLTTFGADHVMTGAFRLADEQKAGMVGATASEALVAWMQAGEAPVYFGLGSMPVLDPEALIRLIGEVTARRGLRAVIGAGWTQIDAATLPEHVTLVNATDHDWLFPKCRAIVHHGGAGTTDAALRAGKPAIVCSVFADQPFWGEQVAKLGVGAHVPFKRLDRAQLEAALSKALSPLAAERAEALGRKLGQENGVADAVAAINRFALQGRELAAASQG
jgi:sterol 3beta-glucosyltransferase